MPTNSPLIFDRCLWRQRRARAALGLAAHDFLHRLAAEQLLERRADTSRILPRVLAMGCWEGVIVPSLLAAGALVTATDAAAAALPQDACSAVVADEEWLPFASGSFDCVLSNLMLQAVNDLPGALVQCRQALAPDGLFLAALLGGATLTELRQALYLAEQEVLGGVSPRVAPSIALDSAAALLQRTGFALPVADSQLVQVRYPHVFALLHDLRGMGLTSIMLEQAPRPPRRLFARLAEIYAERFPAPEGGIMASFELIFLHGWAPPPA